MNGHKPLIELKALGIIPPSVTIVDSPAITDWHENNEQPLVCIHRNKIEALDLRFVKDMIVFIETSDKARSDQLFQKCIDSGARIVSGGVFTKNPSPNARQADSEQRYYNRDAP
jgi:hypothetical protein